MQARHPAVQGPRCGSHGRRDRAVAGLRNFASSRRTTETMPSVEWKCLSRNSPRMPQRGLAERLRELFRDDSDTDRPPEVPADVLSR